MKRTPHVRGRGAYLELRRAADRCAQRASAGVAINTVTVKKNPLIRTMREKLLADSALVLMSIPPGFTLERSGLTPGCSRCVVTSPRNVNLARPALVVNA